MVRGGSRNERSLFFFKGAKGAGWSQPSPSLDTENLINSIPEKLRRKSLPNWPRASEPEIVRHYTWLSHIVILESITVSIR